MQSAAGGGFHIDVKKRVFFAGILFYLPIIFKTIPIFVERGLAPAGTYGTIK